jgi:hypothetical protein
VNAEAAGAGAEQSVLVAAGNDYHHLGMALTASGAGTVAVTPGADVTVVNNRTRAYVEDRAAVHAAKDITVAANSLTDILSVSAGVAGSGLVSVGGAVSVISVNSLTHAHIGNDAVAADEGAIARAGGNILVSASDHTDADVIAGSAGVGIGAVGVGASVAVTVINKDTQAFIGDYAQVDAGGNGAVDQCPDGALTDTGASVEADLRRACQAQSSESVFSLIAAVAAGSTPGSQARSRWEVIKSDTAAFIGRNALVNDDTSAASSQQSVNVSAFNDAQVFSFAGGLGAGIAGIGGGVDVGVLRNNRAPMLTAVRKVHARHDVDINALSLKDVESVAVSAGSGLVGGAGSVSVWALGTRFDATYSDGNTSANA